MLLYLYYTNNPSGSRSPLGLSRMILFHDLSKVSVTYQMQNREYEIRAHGASRRDGERRRLEGQLRELVCWHEWSTPPNLAIAGLLQEAADRIGTLDLVIVRAMLDTYRPLAWAEPAPDEGAERLAAIVTAVNELHRMLLAARPEDKAQLAALLLEQIAILEGGAR